MRINYFSPLPPARSGIAEVAQQVIPALSRDAVVTVWTDQREWCQDLEQFASVRRYDPTQLDYRELHDTDLNVYHIGNNAQFHHGIWQVSQQVPGLVVLHDLKLQHLFYGIVYVRGAQDSAAYVGEISRRYGQEAGLTARAFVHDKLTIAAVEDYAMTEWALENAAAVMVHTCTAFAQLTEYDRWPVGYQPLAFHAPPRLPSVPAVPPPYRLVIFGYIAHNRRVEAVLEALGQLEPRAQFHLDIYGNLDDPDRINRCIEQWQLHEFVTVHGFVPDDVLDRALASAHLAINLRYPTMGEASLSQLRIWRHALPSLVTQVGWYAEQPDDTVCYVRPDYEIADIQQHLQALMTQPDRFRQMGAQGRQRLEALHSPAAYAQAIIRLAQQIKPGYQCRSTQYWLERTAAILAPWQICPTNATALDRLTQSISWLSHRADSP